MTCPDRDLTLPALPPAASAAPPSFDDVLPSRLAPSLAERALMIFAIEAAVIAFAAVPGRFLVHAVWSLFNA